MTPRQLIAAANRKGLAVEVSSPIGMTNLPRNSKGPQVLTDAPLRWAVELSLPCRVLSEANRRDHWTKANRRKRMQNAALRSTLMRIGLSALPLPCVVTVSSGQGWVRTVSGSGGETKLNRGRLRGERKCVRRL